VLQAQAVFPAQMVQMAQLAQLALRVPLVQQVFKAMLA
jgi:hypothetical protein